MQSSDDRSETLAVSPTARRKPSIQNRRRTSSLLFQESCRPPCFSSHASQPLTDCRLRGVRDFPRAPIAKPTARNVSFAHQSAASVNVPRLSMEVGHPAHLCQRQVMLTTIGLLSMKPSNLAWTQGREASTFLSIQGQAAKVDSLVHLHYQ